MAAVIFEAAPTGKPEFAFQAFRKTTPQSPGITQQQAAGGGRALESAIITWIPGRCQSPSTIPRHGATLSRGCKLPDDGEFPAAFSEGELTA
jgi:hypothetical protein